MFTKMIRKFGKIVLITAAPVLLSACSATTNFQASQPNITVKINENTPLKVDTAAPQTYSTTSFGQYRFKATKEGQKPMYGIMPLKFNGGYLVADILFFAPAMFFNLREVYPHYQFDMENGVIRYKKNETDSWTTYQPTPTEAARAEKYFNK